MLKKLSLLVLVLGLVSSTYASAPYVGPGQEMTADDISPVSIYSQVHNGHIWDIDPAGIDRDLFSNFGFEPAAATDPAIEIVFDMGTTQTWDRFTWWNRSTSGNLFAENVDIYSLGNNPAGTPVLIDEDLLTGSRSRGDNDVIVRDDIALTEFTARYIKVVFDDGPQGGGNIQGSEIAFGGYSLLIARDPNPADGTLGVSANPTLSWTAGDSAAGHVVYLGDNFADVDTANQASPEYKITKPLGDETYTPLTLELGEKYYWRIDEVNGGDTWPGDVWNFTVIPPDPPYGLDRGHWQLLNWGLQIQALAGQVVGNLSADRFDESNFTIAMGGGSLNAYSTIMNGRPWGSVGAGADSDFGEEAGTRLVNLQWKDEQDIGNQSEIDEAVYALGQWRIRYPNALGHTVQARNTANNTEIRAYMQQVQPDMLCFDWYPFYSNNVVGGSPTNWYEPLGRYRMLGLEGNDGTSTKPIPTGTWLQTWKKDGHVISESELRLNQFASWAYGYKWTAVFFYNKSLAFNNMLSTLFENTGRNDGRNDDNPTATFYQIAETNRQSRNLGPTLVRLLTTDIRFVRGQYKWLSWTFDNPVPGYASEWSSGADPYITSISVTTSPPGINDGLRGDVLVGYFKPLLERLDGPVYSNQMYFMIVNGLSDPSGSASETQQQIHIEFNFGGPEINSLQRLNRDTGEVEIVPLNHVTGYQYNLNLVLDGGTGDLFKFNTGAPFIVGRPSDFDFDNDVDAADLQVLTDYWVDDTCNWSFWCEHTDLDQSGTVDVVDFAIAALDWMENN